MFKSGGNPLPFRPDPAREGSYTLRCLNVPELRPLGVEMWSELRRGFPHVEDALSEGEKEKGGPYPGRVWSEWKRIPAGFEHQE